MRRATTFAIGAAAAVALAAVVISSRAIGQRAGESTSPNDVGWAADAPVATPSCPPICYKLFVMSENFDGKLPPALPPDWIATNAQGPPPLWGTSNSGVPFPFADTPPNAAFTDDPAEVSDKRLDSPQLGHFVDTVQLTFRHNFNLEASDADPNLGFDGGVLEVSFDGGNTFQDILDAGGTFVEGGYDRVISSDRGSPIAGRQAWSGNSEGFITTVVSLGTISLEMRFRWRMASDNVGSSEGWRVDTVNMSGCEPISCETPTPTPPFGTPTPPATPRPNPTPRSRPSAHPRPDVATPRALTE